MPEVFRDFAEGWRRLHPDWEFCMWGRDGLPPLRNQDLFDRAAVLCPGLEGQLRADILRYELLYQYGGVWIDTDFECRKAIDPLLEGVECFASWVTDDWLNNAIMGAVPGHPFIRRLIDGLPASLAAHPNAAPRVVSGPQYLTWIWRKDPAGVTLFPKESFHPYLWNELDRADEPFPEAYAVHHWGNRRRERGRPL